MNRKFKKQKYFYNIKNILNLTFDHFNMSSLKNKSTHFFYIAKKNNLVLVD